jgi:hypothetical protein
MMPPRPGSVETFRAYLRQRWDAGYRNGRMLFDEIRTLGYGGRYKSLHKVMSPWRLGNVAFERDAKPSSACPAPTISPLPMNIPARQIAPQIAAALLAKPRTELSGRQGDVVDDRNAQLSGLCRHALAHVGVSFDPAATRQAIIDDVAGPNRRRAARLAESR